MVNTEIRFIILFAAEEGAPLYSWQKHELELSVAQVINSLCRIEGLRLQLKKVVRTTTPFSYDLYQIFYDYIVEVINRFKALYLVNRVPEELLTEVITLYRRQ